MAMQSIRKLVKLLVFWTVLWSGGQLIHSVVVVQAATEASPDLTITGLSFKPANPGAGDAADITVVIQNQGDGPAGSFRVHLYVEAADDPPTGATPHTATTFFGLGLAAGQTITWTRTSQTFTQDNPKVYAWVDRDAQVSESDETNNLYPPVDDPPPPGRDAYEDDDACGAAKPLIVNAAAQAHNLYRENDVADEDWVSFEATSGVVYYAKAHAVGADADLYIELHADCDSPSFGSGAEITFTAPADAVYYIKVGHNQEPYGPQTAYQLSIHADNTCTGDYEPNDICAMAGDMTVNAAPQNHSFCQANDADWLRLEVVAGSRYQVSADNQGAKADAQIELHASCDAAAAPLSGQEVEFIAPASGLVYLRTSNLDPNVFGDDTAYHVQVEVVGQQGCSEDNLEQDDEAGQAKPLTVNGPAQTHNTCAAGEEDWARFSATANTTYLVETSSLGEDADTVICLQNAAGEELECDDDGGEGKASRLIWQAEADGDYFVRVFDYDETVAGPTTQYDLRLFTDLCSEDALEPDDENRLAKPITTDGASQPHNFCPINDVDWVSFSATAGAYTIQTSDLGEEADTVLALFDASGQQLAENDDYTDGLASQMVFEFAQAGVYYVRVSQYNSGGFGDSARYALQVTGGAPTPTPTPSVTPPPTETPTPTETPEPPETEVRTLILVNRDRLAELYDAAAADAMMVKLRDLARHGEVHGEIIRLERNREVARTYATWVASPTNVDAAQQVTVAIRHLIMTYLAEHGGVDYVVLVGEDRALPFRRVRDFTESGYSESSYDEVDRNHPTGAALHANHYLTDDFYVDRDPTRVNGRELYIPDLSVGRLIESPAEITAMIEQFLADPILNDYQVLVTGYDFVDDAAQSICDQWAVDLDDNHQPNCALIGQSWSINDFRQRQLSANPPFKIQSINGHAAHYVEGAPGNGRITGSDIANASSDLRGGLIYTLGCHSGLNVPVSNAVNPLDLPEAFTRKQANYVGNTGFGWGLRGAVGLSERLMTLYSRALITGGQSRMGKALTTAKKDYFRELGDIGPYEEKVIQQIIFYGLPMTSIHSSGSLGEGNEFPGVVVQKPGLAQSNQAAASGLMSQTVNIDFTTALAQHTTTNQTPDGQFLALAGHNTAAPNRPIQPLFYTDLNAEEAPVRSLVLRSASFTTRNGFDPAIAIPYNEYVSTPSEQALPQLSAWYPPVPLTLQLHADTVNLVSQLGAFNPTSQELRVYDHLAADIYYSNSADQSGPVVGAVQSRLQDGGIRLKLDARDDAGIAEAFVLYFVKGDQGQATLQRTSLHFDQRTHKWMTSFAGDATTRYFVQVVDGAGNVTTETNKGQYYAPAPSLPPPAPVVACPGGSAACLFLPMVVQ
jgi:hypothetical protein